jgi:hypothetical protein
MKVQGYLNRRLSLKIRKTVSTLETPKEVWDKLVEKYGCVSVATKNRLNNEWEDFVQKPDEPVSDFLEGLEHLAVRMATAGIIKNADDKLFRLLKGLLPQWDGQRQFFRNSLASYDRVCTVLRTLGEENGELVEETALYGRARQGDARGRGYGRAGRGRELSRGKDRDRFDAGRNNRSSSQGGEPWYDRCFVCGKEGHIQSRCPTGLRSRKDKDGNWIPRCYSCQEEGHRARDCKKDKEGGKRTWREVKEVDDVPSSDNDK